MDVLNDVNDSDNDRYSSNSRCFTCISNNNDNKMTVMMVMNIIIILLTMIVIVRMKIII